MACRRHGPENVRDSWPRHLPVSGAGSPSSCEFRGMPPLTGLAKLLLLVSTKMPLLTEVGPLGPVRIDDGRWRMAGKTPIFYPAKRDKRRKRRFWTGSTGWTGGIRPYDSTSVLRVVPGRAEGTYPRSRSARILQKFTKETEINVICRRGGTRAGEFQRRPDLP
jgi:hypothetical protein